MTINQSKIRDPRFWAKWKESGAIGTYKVPGNRTSIIREPVQPVEAIITKYYNNQDAEVKFAPDWKYSSAYVEFSRHIKFEKFPVGTKVIVDSASNGRAMATVRVYDITSRIISDNHPGKNYQRAEPITF